MQQGSVAMFGYEEAKLYLIEQLSKDAQSHVDGRFSEIGAGYEYFDSNLPRCDDPRYRNLFISLNFWDGWQDARNHDWLYYEGIHSHDWPDLAKIIIQGVRTEQDIKDERILRYFGLRPRKTLIQRLKALYRKIYA